MSRQCVKINVSLPLFFYSLGVNDSLFDDVLFLVLELEISWCNHSRFTRQHWLFANTSDFLVNRNYILSSGEVQGRALFWIKTSMLFKSIWGDKKSNSLNIYSSVLWINTNFESLYCQHEDRQVSIKRIQFRINILKSNLSRFRLKYHWITHRSQNLKNNWTDWGETW